MYRRKEDITERFPSGRTLILASKYSVIEDNILEGSMTLKELEYDFKKIDEKERLECDKIQSLIKEIDCLKEHDIEGIYNTEYTYTRGVMLAQLRSLEDRFDVEFN